MKNGREVKIGKKYEYMTLDRKRILIVHNVTEEDVGIYECVLAEDKISLQLALRGRLIKITATKISQTNDNSIKLTGCSICNKYLLC